MSAYVPSHLKEFVQRNFPGAVLIEAHQVCASCRGGVGEVCGGVDASVYVMEEWMWVGMGGWCVCAYVC